jgi:uncharacterized protein (DUF1800 family)
MYENKFHWARKIGFGFRPEYIIPSDINEWNKEQLISKNEEIGLNGKGEWPDDFNFSLEERLNRLHVFMTKKEKYENDKISPDEKNKLIVTARDENRVHLHDVYKYWNNSIYGQDTYHQRLIHFWANHFTVGGSNNFRNYIIGDLIYNTIGENLGGSFSNLLQKVTLHPGMLDYLDNVFSSGENSDFTKSMREEGKTAGLNDNLSRELLELHTVSTAKEYSEKDIKNVAKILAGWGLIVNLFVREFNQEKSNGNIKRNVSLKDFIENPYIKHRAEPGNKTVLGKSFSSGPSALYKLINMLAEDDQTAQHLSRKLAIHFIGENVSEEEIKKIYKIWKATNGDLAEVHRVTLEVAQRTKIKKFLWPSTWMFQCIRLSGAQFISDKNRNNGFGEIQNNGLPKYEPLGILDEIGHNFWSSRQPDGYSEKKQDWVSTEHFDRRIRIASRIYGANPLLAGEEIAEIHEFSDRTKMAISLAKTSKDKFIVALCSPELMEV